MRMHWQNLTDTQRIGHPTGSILRHGRAWLHVGKRVVFRWEWVLWTLRFGAGMHVNCHDDDLTLSVGFPGFQFYWGFEGIFPRKWKTYDLGRSMGFSVHDGSLWIDFWCDQNGWSRDMPWYAKCLCIDPMEIVFGHRKHSERDLDIRDAEIAMPEGPYQVKIRLFESTWKRPRSPLKKKLLRVEVKCEGGVPVPGKGENSWDCGEDAVFSSTFPCGSFEQAVADFTADILKTRGKYGGLRWIPEKRLA